MFCHPYRMAARKPKRNLPVKKGSICKGMTAKRPAMYCFKSPCEHAKFLKADLLPRAGPKHLAMALVRRTFGRRRDAVRRLMRRHIQDLHKPTAKIFMIGQKSHQGEWRPLCDAPDLLDLFRKADHKKGVSSIVRNMRQGARADVDKELTFKLPPESQPDAFVFSATGGKTPADPSTVTKTMQKVRAARGQRTGKEEQISSHTERISMCYWLDQVMKVHHTMAMEWMSIK